MSAIVTLYAGLAATILILLVTLFRLAEEMRSWRREARDYLDMWRWERDQSAYLRKRLDEEMRRGVKDGVYR